MLTLIYQAAPGVSEGRRFLKVSSGDRAIQGRRPRGSGRPIT